MRLLKIIVGRDLLDNLRCHQACASLQLHGEPITGQIARFASQTASEGAKEMLSITTVSVGQAGHYYSKVDYYAKAYGQWQGKGAELLGFRGEVSKEAFQKKDRPRS